MIALNIFLAVMAAFFGFGSVGDRIQKNRDNYTRGLYCLYHSNYNHKFILRKVKW